MVQLLQQLPCSSMTQLIVMLSQLQVSSMTHKTAKCVKASTVIIMITAIMNMHIPWLTRMKAASMAMDMTAVTVKAMSANIRVTIMTGSRPLLQSGLAFGALCTSAGCHSIHRGALSALANLHLARGCGLNVVFICSY